MQEKLAKNFPKSLGNFLPYGVKRNLCLQPLRPSLPPLQIPQKAWPKSTLFFLPNSIDEVFFTLPVLQHFASLSKKGPQILVAEQTILEFIKGFFPEAQLIASDTLYLDDPTYLQLLQNLTENPPEALFCLDPQLPLRLLRLMGQCPTPLRISISAQHHPFANLIISASTFLKALTQLTLPWEFDCKNLFNKIQLGTGQGPESLFDTGTPLPPFLAVFFWNPFRSARKQNHYLQLWLDRLSTYNPEIKSQVVIADGHLAQKLFSLPKKWSTLRFFQKLPLGKTLLLLEHADAVAGLHCPALALGHLARKKIQLFGVQAGHPGDTRWLFPTAQIDLT